MRSRAVKLLAAGTLSFLMLFLLAFERNNDLFFQIKKQITIFGDVYREVAVHYIDEISPEKLMRKGIDSMLESLDPYTLYVPEGEQHQLEILSTGSYGGVGIEAGYRGEDIVIIAPHPGYPAHRAGLRAGDIIRSIDGVEIHKMEPAEVREMTVGNPGSVLEIVIERPGISEPISFSLVRERIEVKNITLSSRVGDNAEFGYVQLARFGKNAAEELRTVLLDFQNEGNLEGLILDLRNNPGGLLNEAVEIVDKFIEPGVTIVETRSRVGSNNSILSTQEVPLFENLPVVILINKGSASASEIVAGALQDLDRAVILGETSFGKGLVQTIRPLSYNTSLKLTIAEYFIPSGRGIQALNYTQDDTLPVTEKDSRGREFKTRNGRIVTDGNGIEPDIRIESMEPSLLEVALQKENRYLFFINHLLQNEEAAQMPDNLFEQFTRTLVEEQFTFQTPADRHISALREDLDQFLSKESAEDHISSLESLVRDYKIHQMYEHQKAIEAELTIQWLRQTGVKEGDKEILGLDSSIQTAVEIIGNPYKYQTVLRP